MEEEWLVQARLLPLGHKLRMNHDCSQTRDLIVSHGENGYSAYCFRCGNVGFSGHGYRNLEELQRVQELNSEAHRPQPRGLPSDFSTDIPPRYLTWLGNAGISVPRAHTLNFGWSARLHRIIMPLYGKDHDLLYWQARAVDKGQSPKYVNPPTDKASLLYRCQPRDYRGGKERVIVTEDILSAVRIGKFIPARSILGTKTSDQQAARLGEYTNADYWLDPDRAGWDGTKAGTRRMGLVTNSRGIYSDADPKNLADREICRHLNIPYKSKWSSR